METDGLEDFDFTQPLHYALSQLRGEQEQEFEFKQEMPIQEFGNGAFPKPSSLSAMTEIDEFEKPPTTQEIIDELWKNLTDYPKTVRLMMQRGLMKRKQDCKKCDRKMNLRRRKNCYEWRCRTKDKKGDCSSCSIKTGSWFEYSKLPFPTIFNFLLMHCKGYTTQHIANELNLSSHSVNDTRRFLFHLTDRIHKKYSKIGQNNQEVYLEIIGLKPKPTVSVASTVLVLAGRELRSNRCFAVILPDSNPSTFERIKNEHVAPDAIVRKIKTVHGEASSFPDSTFFDEVSFYSNPNDRFFLNLRKDPSEFIFSNHLLGSWLTDQIVRKTEGTDILKRCVEEMMTYTN